MKKAFIFTFAFLAIQFVAQLLVTISYTLITGVPADSLPPLWHIGVMVLFSLLTILVFLRAGWFEASRSYLRSRPWDVIGWRRGSADCRPAALGALVPSLLLQGLIPEWSGWAKEIVDETNKQMEGLMSVPGGYMVIALLPPVVEEMVFRGCVLRSLLEWKPRHRWWMIALWGVRFLIEFVKEEQVDFEKSMSLDMGQWLSVPMIVAGIVIVVLSHKGILKEGIYTTTEKHNNTKK